MRRRREKGGEEKGEGRGERRRGMIGEKEEYHYHYLTRIPQGMQAMAKIVKISN